MRRPLLLVLIAAAVAGCPQEPPTATKPAPKRSPGATEASTSPSTGPSTAASASVKPSTAPSGSAAPSASPSASPSAAPVGPLVLGLRKGGFGLPASKVSLTQLFDLALEADGGLMLSHLGRLQRLTKDGLLESASAILFDTGSTLEATPLDGVKLVDAQVQQPTARARDAQGRWLIAQPKRLARLEADGKLAEIWPVQSGMAIAGAVPLPNGDVLVLVKRGQTSDPTYDAWTVKPDKTRTKLHTFAAEDEALLDGLVVTYSPFGTQQAVAPDGQGGMLLWLAEATGRALYRFNPETKALTRAADAPVNGLFLDGAGHLFLHSANTRKLEVRKLDGTTVTLTENLPEGFQPLAATLASDGSASVVEYVSNLTRPQRVVRIKNGEVTVLSGVDATLPTQLDEVDLAPLGLAVTGPGTVFVGDQLRGRVLKLVPGQGLSVVAGLAGGPKPADGLEAVKVALDPGALRLDGAGNLYLINARTDGDQVLKVLADGKLQVLYTLAPGTAEAKDRLVDLAVTPAGEVTVLTQKIKAGLPESSALWRLEGTTPKTLPTPVAIVTAIATAPDGALASVGYETRPATGAITFTMARWTADKGVTKLQTFTRDAASLTGLAIAAGGQYVIAGGPGRGTLFVVDPVNGTAQTLAGPGGAHFIGKTTDEGVRGPTFPAFDAAGNLYFSDNVNSQVKAIQAENL